jgi:hypothetical protein
MLQRRANASAPLWDDRLLMVSNGLMNNPDFLKLVEQVLNGEKPVSALEQEAPASVNRNDARAFAGSLPFIEGWIRDTCASITDAEYVNAQQSCECADAATCLHVKAEARTQGVALMPDDQTYLAERAAQQQATAAAHPTRMPDTFVGGGGAEPVQSAEPTGLGQLEAEIQHTPIKVGQDAEGSPQAPAGPVPVSEAEAELSRMRGLPQRPAENWVGGTAPPNPVAAAEQVLPYTGTDVTPNSANTVVNPPNAGQPVAPATVQAQAVPVAGQSAAQPPQPESVPAAAQETYQDMSNRGESDAKAADANWEAQKDNVN